MSLNQLVSANTLYTDDRRLNVKFGNVDALDITGQKITTRQYQQIQQVVNTGTNVATMINTVSGVGNEIIKANTLKSGSKIIIKARGNIDYATGNQMNFYFRFNGTRYILNSNFQLSQTYTSGSIFEITQTALVLFTGALRVFTKIELQKPLVTPGNTQGAREVFMFQETGGYSIDLTIDNVFELQNVFFSAGGTILVQDLEMNLMI
jgi:hypothetical protein